MKRMSLAFILGLSVAVLILPLPSLQMQDGGNALYLSACPFHTGVWALPSEQRDAPFIFPPMDSYRSYDEMVSDIENMTSTHPAIARVLALAETWEGRSVYAVEISDNDSMEEEPSVLIMGAHHGNEQVSAMVPYYFITFLLENYGINKTITDLVNGYDIWLVPMVNPDGYEHQTRKNRRPNGDGTYGVDLNRNYWYHWGLTGASDNPSDLTYHGPHPFSEPETRAIRDLAEQQRFVLSVSYHSYSQTGLFVHPWGYDYNAKTKDHELMEAIAKRIGGEELGYTWGQSSDPNIGMYNADGDSDDWLYGNLSTLAFTCEIKADSFNPPQSELQGICSAHAEALVDFVALASNPEGILGSGLRGYVKGPDNKPIVGAEVDIYNDDRNYHAETDADGYYHIDAQSGVYTLSITHDGYADILTYITIPSKVVVWYNATMMKLNDHGNGGGGFFIASTALYVGNEKLNASATVGISMPVKAVLNLSLPWSNASAWCDLYSNSGTRVLEVGMSPATSDSPGTYDCELDLSTKAPGTYYIDFRAYVNATKNSDLNGADNGTYDFMIRLKDDIPPNVTMANYCLNGTTCYSNGKEVPIGSTPEFRVTVKDNQGGGIGEVRLVVQHDGVEIDNVSMYMVGGYFSVIWNTSPLNEGTYTIYFYVTDVFGNSMSTLGGESHFNITLVNNSSSCRTNDNAPMLIDPGVSPTQGGTDTEFTFTVTYIDTDGTPPEYVYIWIDGVKYTMDPTAQNGDYSKGVVFQYTTYLPEGKHSYKITASDGTYSNETALISGPEVVGSTWKRDDTNLADVVKIPLLAQIAIILLIIILLAVMFYLKVRRYK